MKNPWKTGSDWHIDNSQFKLFQQKKRQQSTVSKNEALEGIPVESSAIKEIKYDKESKVLSVFFVNGKIWYDFPNVPEAEVESFLDSISKGGYYHANIKKYSVRRK